MMFRQRMCDYMGESRWLNWPMSASWHPREDRDICFLQMCYSGSKKEEKNFGMMSYSWSRSIPGSISWRHRFVESHREWGMMSE